jgi:LacI family transcriptional regulator
MVIPYHNAGDKPTIKERTILGKVTSKEIAQLAGVSVSAVSIVLNNKPGVSEETRKRILHILSEHGIFPKATNLVDEANGIIRFCKIVKHGRIINDKHNVFLSDYIDGVVEESKRRGYIVEFATYNTNRVSEVVAELKKVKGLYGVIVLATELDSDDITLFEELEISYVFLDAMFQFSPGSFVTMDNQGMVFEAVQYLKSCGHRSIGMLVATGCSNFSQRREAFELSLKQLGIDFNPQHVFTISSIHEDALKEMQEILDHMDRKALPSAFFACNDMVAIGAMQAIHAARLRIPEDISIVGFDDLPAATVVTPSLTSMSVPKFDIGRAAVSLLLDSEQRAFPNDVSHKVVIGGHLVKRGSVGKVG